MKHTLSWLLSVCLFLCSFASYSQTPDFTVDTSVGCSSPGLPVTFINKSAGFSGNAKYELNYGEGGAYVLFPASPHPYIKPGVFTATLRVTDNSSVYTQTKQITIYHNPVADFYSDVAKTCAKTAVTYTSSSTAGDGTIANYYWDFGDGNTLDTTAGTVLNQYSSAKSITASLTVTNSYGCFNSVTKPGIVTILPAPKVSFTANQTSVCNETDAVTFTNTTSGGALPTSYLWNFDDGTSGTDVNPTHIFGVKGKFGVRLLATSAEGCSDTSKSTWITVASSKSGIALPTLLCLNGKLTFADSSLPLTNNPVWLLDNNVVATNVHQYTTVFTDTKTHKLQLVNSYGNCSDTATKIIQAQASPIPSPFTINIQGFCSLPATATFTDAGLGSTKWEWDFNNTVETDFNPTAFTKSAVNTYTAENTYYVKLRVTDASGCTGEIRQPITIKKNKTTLTSSEGVYGCKTLATTFKATSTNPVAAYNWTFSDDNSTSVLDTPQHIFIKKGTYKVFLQLKTIGGCNDTASLKIHIGDEPFFDFTPLTDTVVCSNTKITFDVIGDTDRTVGQYYWNFGDAGRYILMSGPVYTHQYLTDSVYTVSLAINNHGCNDTITKTKYLTVLPPIPDITTVTNSCNDRLQVTLKEASKKARTYSWNFGDGSPTYDYDSTNRATEIVHTFSKTGAFKVVLTTANNGCVGKDSVTVRTLKNQKPLLTAKQAMVCANDSLETTVSGMETNPYGSGYRYAVKEIQYGNGAPFTGSFSMLSVMPVNPFYVNIKKLNPGDQTIRIITSSFTFNCPDTTNYIPVQVNGPKAGFEAADTNLCLSDKIWLTDTSKADGAVPIANWQWFFGDSTNETLTTDGNTSHKYTDAGNFKIKLVVTDAEGCRDTAYYSGSNLTIKGPKAKFAAEQNPILPNTPEIFTNLTDSGYAERVNNSYNWLFGDGSGSSSNADKVSHSYKLYSDDTVTLVAKSSQTGCSDTAFSVIHVKNTNLSFTYTSSFLNPNSTCPPVLAKFKNTSVNFDIVSWDFGDGFTADNINAPSHTYYKPGTYKVTIFGYYSDNTYDSAWEYVNIAGPIAVLHADVTAGCGAKQVMFSAETQNATSLIWDFGDGTSSPDSMVTHVYTAPNIYTPTLIVKNGGQCSFSYPLQTPVVIDSISIYINKDSVIQCHQLLVNFTPKIFSFAKDNGQQLNYTWQFGTGTDSSKLDTTAFVYTKPGFYPVSFIASSPYGCSDTATTEIAYTDAVPASIQGPSEFCENTPVSFSAIKTNSSDVLTYNWQFQNGTSALQNPPPQTFAASGNDTVKLIVNNNGCTDTLYQKLVLHKQPDIMMIMSDSIVCLGGAIVFSAEPVNTASQEPVDYFWNLGTGKDSAAQQSASFVYSNYGAYQVSLAATSAFGCNEKLIDSVTISPNPVASIQSPTDICINGSAVFAGSSAVASAQYLWHFSDNTTSTQQNPPPKTYTSAGTDNLYLVASIGGCHDTAYHSLMVHDYPQANLTPATPRVCLGDSVQLTAHNGQIYQWLNTAFITGTAVANPYVFPAADTKYTVLVTDSYGCKNMDSVTVLVTKPQKIAVVSPVNVCIGNRANLAASGTDICNWVNGTDLNSAAIATPVTKDSAQNKIYTVVGSDAYGCFEDTALVEVIVRTKPVVDAGSNTTVPAGTPVQLSATASGNITSWNWQPPAYLSCTGCASPVSKLHESTVYTAEATDNYGCKGTDTVRVTVVCKESLVNIPQIFSPNGDGKNDRFRITAYGVKIITHFVIYGRSGNKIWERSNVGPQDTDASWDGMSNNAYMPTGTYIYILQAVCDAGQVYNLQGTVTLMR